MDGTAESMTSKINFFFIPCKVIIIPWIMFFFSLPSMLLILYYSLKSRQQAHSLIHPHKPVSIIDQVVEWSDQNSNLLRHEIYLTFFVIHKRQDGLCICVYHSLTSIMMMVCCVCLGSMLFIKWILPFFDIIWWRSKRSFIIKVMHNPPQ